MEAENKLYAETHGDGQVQPPPADPPQYTPVANTQMQPQYIPAPEQQQQQQPGQFQGYPPYDPSTAAPSPYYVPPSGTGYGGGYGVPPASQHHHQQQPGQFQGYPPYDPSASAPSPYYAPPSGAGYGGGYGVPPASQQQQQQVTVVATQPVPVIYVQPDVSFTGAIVYSCVVACCVNLFFGVIGIILASKYTPKSTVVE